MAVNETMTTGVLNALGKRKSRTVCPSCGFPLPVYPGRYPSKCPHCKAARSTIHAPKPDGDMRPMKEDVSDDYLLEVKTKGSLSKSKQKVLLKHVFDLLLARRMGNPRREQRAYGKLRAYTDKIGADLDDAIEQGRKRLSKQSAAAILNSIV